jgi:hypothetical protein
MVTHVRHQRGYLRCAKRKNGPSCWEFLWREDGITRKRIDGAAAYNSGQPCCSLRLSYFLLSVPPHAGRQPSKHAPATRNSIRSKTMLALTVQYSADFLTVLICCHSLLTRTVSGIAIWRFTPYLQAIGRHHNASIGMSNSARSLPRTFRLTRSFPDFMLR